MLREEQLRAYERDGYLQLDSFVGADWLDRLRATSSAFIQESCGPGGDDWRFDVEPDHRPDSPRLRRLVSPVDLHETFFEFAFAGPAARLATELLGGPVRFHHSKLNYKWSDGGAEVKWHQDIQFWPHTDFTPLTIGVYLDDVDDEMGPMGVVPGSHRGPLYDLYDPAGAWAGAMRDDDVARLDLDDVEWLQGPAGSVTVHNCCMVHGSQPNRSDRPRPLLLQTYSALGSFPVLGIGANGVDGANTGRVIDLDGVLAEADTERLVEIGGRAMRGAPDWRRKRPPTIFGSQQSP